MGERPDDLERTMTETRDRIAQTVHDLSGALSDSTTDARDRLGDALDALPLDAKVANPMPLLIAAAVGGFIVGLVVPLVALERERLRPVADEIARRASRTRDEVVSQGLAVARETVTAAKQSAEVHGREMADHLGG